MATPIVVPGLGESVTEATVAKWMKKVGDPVKADEALAELETDKVTQELFAPAAGTLAEIIAPAGSTVAIGAVIGQISEGAVAAAPAPRWSGARKNRRTWVRGRPCCRRSRR
jgi:2-oxoglutarate dehydrogenase E2 component (dihydrolipoamide succinyltransferase)